MMLAKRFPVSFFYPWRFVQEEMYHSVMLDFRDHGAEHFVFVQEWIEQVLKDHLFFLRLKEHLRDSGMDLLEAHAPNGPEWDLNCLFEGRRSVMLEEHKRAMCYAAEAGCLTYTIHVGAGQYLMFRNSLEELHEAAKRSLDVLVPYAEHCGITLAVEHSFEPPNGAHQVVALLKEYDSPALGCCYDAGHANVMSPSPAKRQELYTEHMKWIWQGDVKEVPGILDILSPWIVTAHLHDNNGYCDMHALPGTGTVDWPVILAKLAACPRLKTIQSEIHCNRAENDVTPARICRAMSAILA